MDSRAPDIFAIPAEGEPAAAPVRFWHLAVIVFGGTGLGLLLALAAFQLPVHLFVHRYSPRIQDFIEQMRLVTFYRANIGLAAAYLPIIAACWGMARLTTPEPFKEYFRRVRSRTIVFCLMGGAAVMAGTGAFVWSSKHYTGIDLSLPDSFVQESLMPTTPGELAVSLIGVAFIGPLCEEFFFRGLLLRWLMTRLSKIGAIAVSALLFSLFHGTLFVGHIGPGLFHFADIAAFGVIAGVLVMRTGSLLPGFALHLAYNTAIAVAGLLPLPS